MKILLDAVPVAQGRMRVANRGSFSGLYDPMSKQKAQIRQEMQAYVKRYAGGSLLHSPRISFVFHMPIPKSTPKKWLPLFESGLLKHEKKPDVDNLAKLYLDCLDGISFCGDQKVTLGPSVKLYHPYPKSFIILQETSSLLSPLEVDPLTWFALFGVASGRCSYDQMVALPDWYTPDQLAWQQPAGSFYPQQIAPASEPALFAQHQKLQDALASYQSHLRLCA